MSSKLTKAELISRLSEAAEFTKKDCDTFLSKLSEVVLAILKEKKDVTIGSIGTLKYKVSKARICKVIKTGQSIQIPAKGGVTFKTSQTTKDVLASIV